MISKKRAEAAREALEAVEFFQAAGVLMDRDRGYVTADESRRYLADREALPCRERAIVLLSRLKIGKLYRDKIRDLAPHFDLPELDEPSDDPSVNFEQRRAYREMLHMKREAADAG